MFTNEDDLTAAERAVFAALPRELEPGDILEERIVRALRGDGHFGVRRSNASRWIGRGWRVAAALMLFAGGVATGRYLLAPASPAVNRAMNESSAAQRPQAPTAQVRGNERVVAVEMWL